MKIRFSFFANFARAYGLPYVIQEATRVVGTSPVNHSSGLDHGKQSGLDFENRSYVSSDHTQWLLD